MTAMSMALSVDDYRLKFEDWLDFPDDGHTYELIGGEVFVVPPPSIGHQRVSRELEFRILTHLRAKTLGEVFDAPVGVRLGPDTVVEPDLVVVLDAHKERIGTQLIEGPPDLVVEILSPGSASRDLELKRRLYEESQIPEYWIVDPKRRAIEILVLEGPQYISLGTFGPHDRAASRIVPGLEIDLAEIF